VSAVKISLEFEPPAQGRLDAELVPLAEAPHVLDIAKSSLACTASELPKFVSTEWRTREVTRWVYERFSRVEFYQFDKLMMHGPAYSDEAHPVLGSRGENLAAVLEAI